MLGKSGRIIGSPMLANLPFFVLLVTVQIVFGATVSHFGLPATLTDALTLRKLAGLVLAVGGSYLVTFR